VETTFAFRTRILDYLWASLPMVVTEGDYFGDVVAAQSLGVAVPAGDVVALTKALEKVLYDEAAPQRYRHNIDKVRSEYYWPRVLGPLVHFVDQVSRGEGPAPRVPGRAVRYSPHRPRPPRFRPADIGLAFQRLFRGEFQSLWRALLRRLRPSGR